MLRIKISWNAHNAKEEKLNLLSLMLNRKLSFIMDLTLLKFRLSKNT